MILTGEFQAWLSRRTGIDLSRGGASRVLTQRVLIRSKELGVGVDEYLSRIGDSDTEELNRLINAVTVVYTWFFRDRGQLAAVQEAIIRAEKSSKLRVWVPGCATGEDAYSIALLAARAEREVDILATDINTVALERATRGVYSLAQLHDVDTDLLAYFDRLPDGKLNLMTRIRERVCFQRHNLVDPVPRWQGVAGWDIILCRNVLIYFEQQSALGVLERMVRALKPGGTLILGAGEVLYDVPEGVDALYLCGRLVLKKPLGGPSPPPVAGRLSRAPVPTLAVREHHHAPVPAVPPKVESIAPPVDTDDSEPCREALKRGHALLDSGRITEAQSEYRNATEFDATSAESQLYLGVTHYLAGELPAAAHHLRAALFLDEGLWPAAFYLALSYESMGLVNDARREFRHLLRIENAHNGAGLPPHALLAGWYRDVIQLARGRVEGTRGPLDEPSHAKPASHLFKQPRRSASSEATRPKRSGDRQ